MDKVSSRKPKQPWNIYGGLLCLAVLVLAVVALINPLRQPSGEATGLQVVAAENMWGDIARQIGGDRVHVTSIINDPGVDPHLYESNAQNAAATAHADLVVLNGLGYDDFMEKLLRSSQASHRHIIRASDVTHSNTASSNPHLWYNLTYATRVAEAIATDFKQQDPSHATIYAQNLVHFKTSLVPLQTVTDAIALTYTGTPIAYTERVSGYLVANTGLRVASPAGFAMSIEDGNDPNPSDVAAMNSLFESRSVGALLYNTQVTSPVTQKVQALAKLSGVPIVGMTETLPKGATNYQTWQLQQLKALQAALVRKK